MIILGFLIKLFAATGLLLFGVRQVRGGIERRVPVDGCEGLVVEGRGALAHEGSKPTKRSTTGARAGRSLASNCCFSRVGHHGVRAADGPATSGRCRVAAVVG